MFKQLVSVLGEHAIHPSYLSYPSSMWGLDVIAPDSTVMEALADDGVEVGDWVWLLSVDGVQQNVIPYQIRAMARGPDERGYARFAETPTGWPLAQCARADPSDTEQPPPCAVCRGTECWDHAGIWRCVTCWPLENCRTNAKTDVAASIPGPTRGDSP